MNEIPSPNDNKEEKSTYFEGVGVSEELISQYREVYARLEDIQDKYNLTPEQAKKRKAFLEGEGKDDPRGTNTINNPFRLIRPKPLHSLDILIEYSEKEIGQSPYSPDARRAYSDYLMKNFYTKKKTMDEDMDEDMDEYMDEEDEDMDEYMDEYMDEEDEDMDEYMDEEDEDMDEETFFKKQRSEGITYPPHALNNENAPDTYIKIVKAFEGVVIAALESLNEPDREKREKAVREALDDAFDQDKMGFVLTDYLPRETPPRWLVYIVLSILDNPDITPLGRLRVLELLQMYPIEDLEKGLLGGPIYDRENNNGYNMTHKPRIPYTLCQDGQQRTDTHSVFMLFGSIEGGYIRSFVDHYPGLYKLDELGKLITHYYPIEAVQLALLLLHEQRYIKQALGILVYISKQRDPEKVEKMLGPEATFLFEHKLEQGIKVEDIKALQNRLKNKDILIQGLQEKLEAVSPLARAEQYRQQLDPQGYYRTLGIDPIALTALPEDKVTFIINKAYKAMAQVYHPDIEGTGDTAMMQAINKAYNALRTPQNREEYITHGSK